MRNMPPPPTPDRSNDQPAPARAVLIVVSGGVAYVVENPSELPIEILDFDNLRESVEDPTCHEINLSSLELDYIRRTDPRMYAALQPKLAR